MTGPAEPPLLAVARAVWEAGVAAVDPDALVRRNLVPDRRGLEIRDDQGRTAACLPVQRGVRVLGTGKAAAAMAAAAREVLADHLTCGVMSMPEPLPAGLDPIRCLPGSHPLPAPSSVRAAEACLALARSTPSDQGVLGLLSGGGSALLALPAEGVPLEDKVAAVRLLLEAGASIHELNALRKHLSAIKGGLLGAACAPSPTVVLVLSDVPGDDLSTVASGPFGPDATTFAEALEVARRLGLEKDLPGSVLRRLQAGADGRLPETPKPGDPRLERCRVVRIGGGRTALEGAAREARRRGFEPLLEPEPWTTETSAAAQELARRAAALRSAGRRRALLISAELRARVTGPGRGGRCTDLALRVTPLLDGRQGVLLLAAGSDGIDGSSDAAGAWVDGSTLRRIQRAGANLERGLRASDSHTVLDAAGGLIRSGPTGTNVADLLVLLVEAPP